jgi:Tol biopolymer transport system component
MIRYISLILLLLMVPPFSCGDTSRGTVRSVAISPDGKLVAVEIAKGSSSFNYVVPVDTGNATRLRDAKDGVESNPTFSPDGKRIAFAYRPGNHERERIIIANIDGSDAHPWSASGSDDLSPVFSPDNKTIVFSRSGFYGSYSRIAQPHPHSWNFYAADSDGTHVRQVTNESFYITSPASVSPDGKSMVIVAEGLASGTHIAIYSLDHTGPPALSLQPHVPKEVDHKNPILTYPNYMPDGKSILFMAASNGKHGFDYDVYRVDIGTGSLERLTDGNGYATDLKVSADGKTAVFLKWRLDWHKTPIENEVCLLDVQNHALTLLKINGMN